MPQNLRDRLDGAGYSGHFKSRKVEPDQWVADWELISYPGIKIWPNPASAPQIVRALDAVPARAAAGVGKHAVSTHQPVISHRAGLVASNPLPAAQSVTNLAKLCKRRPPPQHPPVVGRSGFAPLSALRRLP